MMPLDEMEACLRLFEFLQVKHAPSFIYFATPAMASLHPTQWQQYESIVSRPMDLGTVLQNLQMGVYASRQDFQNDILLCFDNCKKFCSNMRDFHHVAKIAETLQKVFIKKIADLDGGHKRQEHKSAVLNMLSSGRESIVLAPTVIPMTGHKALLDDKIIKMIKCESGVAFMLHPVLPTAHYYHDYMIKIQNPMDFETLQDKLYKDKYKTLNEFAFEFRRIFANALRFNCHMDKDAIGIRKVVTNIILKWEQRWLDLNKKHFPSSLLPPPLPEFKICLYVLEDLFRLPSSSEIAKVGNGAITSFIDPVELQLHGDQLKDYMAKVDNPMDYGTIISKLVEAESYKTVNDVLEDVALVTQNCITYWSAANPTSTEGIALKSAYMYDAKALETTFREGLASKTASVGLMNTMVLVSSKQPAVKASERIAWGGGGATNTRNSDADLGNRFKMSFGQQEPQPIMKYEQPIPVSQPIDQPLQQIQYTQFPPLEQQQQQYAHLALSKMTFKVGGGNTRQLLQPAAPRERAPSPPPPLHPGFPLFAKAPSGIESDGALLRRASKYCTFAFQYCIDEIQKHYIVNPQGIRISTSNPFVAKVDTRTFPEYEKFIISEGREEVYLQFMSRKVRSDRYGFSVSQILADMMRLHENAHAFNVGDDNIEIRIMVDALLNYFKYLIRSMLRSLPVMGDTGMARLLTTPDLVPLLDEPDSPDVLTFLAHLQADNIKAREEEKAAAAAKATAEAAALEKKRKSITGWGGVGVTDYYAGLHEYPMDPYLDYSVSGGMMGGGSLDMGLPLDFPVLPEVDLYPNPDPLPLPEFRVEDPYPKVLKLPKAQPYVRVSPAWEVAATGIMKKITKHPFVDLTTQKAGGALGVSKSKVIADFFHPVVERFPHLAQEYLKCVPKPMDLALLGEALFNGTLFSASEFCEKLQRVFTNAATYNTREAVRDDNSCKEVAAKGLHLARYSKWLCLENLPLMEDEEDDDDSDDDMSTDRARDVYGDLRQAVQAQERLARENILKNAKLTAALECRNKWLLPFKKTKGNEEKYSMNIFCVPPIQPSDYAIYVRRPMDLGNITQKLDKSINGTQGAYSSYGEFFADMRLVFTNAIKYNSAHLNDEGSVKVYEAALRIQKKLEDMLPKFTLDLAERTERERVSATAQEKRLREDFEMRLIQKQELEAFEELERARRLADDAAFAADQDIEAKKAKTAAEKQEFVDQELLKRQAAMEEAGVDADFFMSGDNVSMDVQLPDRSIKEVPRLRGYACGDVVPPRLLPFWRAKRFCREQAWEAWGTVRRVGTSDSIDNFNLSEGNGIQGLFNRVTTDPVPPRIGWKAACVEPLGSDSVVAASRFIMKIGI